MKLLLIWLVPLAVGLLLSGANARAGYNDGLAAMERGDYATALEEFEALAGDGHREAQFTLAFLYDFGQGTDPDPAQALKWYRAAAEQGLEEAQLALALMYADGRGVTQDHGEAAAWYRRAAEQGNALAQNDLADLYRQGKGVPRDPLEAFVWYDAATQNLPSGEVRDAVVESRDGVAEQLTDEQLAEAVERAEAFQPETEFPPLRPRGTAEAPAPGPTKSESPQAPPPAEQDAPDLAADPGPEESDAPPQATSETAVETPDEVQPSPPAEVATEISPDEVAEALPAPPAEPVAPEAPADAPAEIVEPTEAGPDTEQLAALPAPEAQAPLTPTPETPAAEATEESQPAPVWRQLSDQEIGQVIRVQGLLDRLGYDPGPADGKPGGRTTAAVRAFEADHSWPLSGEITDRLEQTLIKVAEGRKLARFGAGDTAAQPSPQGATDRTGNPGFNEMLKNLLAEGRGAGNAASDQSELAALPSSPSSQATDPAAAPAIDVPLSEAAKAIDERLASLESVVAQVGTVSAAGLGWNLLQEWERTSATRLRQAIDGQTASDFEAGLKSRRQSQIVLGDPYGNFLRVTDSYRLFLETLKERFR